MSPMAVKTETRVITARSTCNDCEFDRGGRDAPQRAVEHAEETGHTVSLNTNAFTTIKGKQDG